MLPSVNIKHSVIIKTYFSNWESFHNAKNEKDYP